ncbi:MAG: type II toxin-antitoxin system VapC family toxin [Thaumarchaeota archaeon]|nr:type II toxin-antitoxin system VapC family toxin [Nitrososphaerota archaeon]
MKVIDSSSLAKYVNREENWTRVRDILGDGCVTLDLAVKEVGNSLWKRVVRRDLSADVALSAYSDFVRLKPFKMIGQEDLYVKSFEISARFSMPIYDALFVQLALRLGVKLVTSDKNQAEVSRKLGVDVLYL